MKLKYSIRRQVTALFIALLAFILGGVLVINSGFLVSYYLSHKTEELVKTYNEIDRTLQNGDLTDLSVLKTILVRTERGNIDLVVVDSSGKAHLISGVVPSPDADGAGDSDQWQTAALEVTPEGCTASFVAEETQYTTDSNQIAIRLETDPETGERYLTVLLSDLPEIVLTPAD